MSPSPDHLPSYETLIGVWRLGHDLGIEGLCDATLDAMAECRRVTQHIPATPLLVQVWKDTPEGSSIRRLLLGWAAEYMRSSESRAEFARSLPQEVLSELVVAMSSLESGSPPVEADAEGLLAPATAAGGQRRSVAEAALDEGEGGRPPAKKRRASDDAVNGASSAGGGAAQGGGGAGRKQGQRAALPGSKPGPKPGPKRRTSAAVLGTQQFSANQKLNFCADLLARMLSGPGKFLSPPSPSVPFLPQTQVDRGTDIPLLQASGRAWSAPSRTPSTRSGTGCPTTWPWSRSRWT